MMRWCRLGYRESQNFKSSKIQSWSTIIQWMVRVLRGVHPRRIDQACFISVLKTRSRQLFIKSYHPFSPLVEDVLLSFVLPLLKHDSFNDWKSLSKSLFLRFYLGET